jgi:hypothetical protein
MSEGYDKIKQAPKPVKATDKDWSDLQEKLNAHFHNHPDALKMRASVNPEEYKISGDEIKEVLEYKGYVVELGSVPDQKEILTISLPKN